MLKKVALVNSYTGKTVTAVVDTDDNDKAVIGAGKAPNEVAKVSDIVGFDETIHRLSMPKQSMEDRANLFSGSHGVWSGTSPRARASNCRPTA